MVKKSQYHLDIIYKVAIFAVVLKIKKFFNK